jgi:cytochrome c1
MIWVIIFLIVFFVLLYRVKGIDGPDPRKNDIWKDYDER